MQARDQLCGACEENYTLPVYSYYIGCVKCEGYEYGWLKFVAAAFVPLTAFYILVIVFLTLNGLVLVSQIRGAPSIICEIFSYNQANGDYYVSSFSQLGINTGIAIYAIWNLDFFVVFTSLSILVPT